VPFDGQQRASAGEICASTRKRIRQRQMRMIALPRRIFQRGRNVAGLQQRVIRQNFPTAGASGQQIEYVTHADAQATQTRPAAALSGIDGDAIGFCSSFISKKAVGGAAVEGRRIPGRAAKSAVDLIEHGPRFEGVNFQECFEEAGGRHAARSPEAVQRHGQVDKVGASIAVPVLISARSICT